MNLLRLKFFEESKKDFVMKLISRLLPVVLLTSSLSLLGFGQPTHLTIHNTTDGQIKVHLWKYLSEDNYAIYPIEFTMEKKQTCKVSFIRIYEPITITSTSGATQGNQLILKRAERFADKEPAKYDILIEIKSDPQAKKLIFSSNALNEHKRPFFEGQ